MNKYLVWQIGEDIFFLAEVSGFCIIILAFFDWIDIQSNWAGFSTVLAIGLGVLFGLIWTAISLSIWQEARLYKFLYIVSKWRYGCVMGGLLIFAAIPILGGLLILL